VPVETAYPTGRLDRAEPLIALGAPAGVPPTFREWPFRIGASVANARTMVVSPAFVGPALIHHIDMSWGTAATTGVTFALYWSNDPSGQGQNLASTFRPSGTPILDPISHLTPAVADTDEIREHFDQTQAGVVTPIFVPSRFRYYVPRAGQFFLKAMVRNGAAGTFDMKGWIGLLENVTPEVAGNFL